MPSRAVRCLVLSLLLLASCSSPQLPPETSNDLGSLTTQVAAVVDGHSDTIHLTDDSFRGDYVETVSSLSNLKQLKLDCASNLSPAVFSDFAELRQLEQLKVGCVEVDDAAAAHIAQLERLRFLNLPDANISNQGLLALAALPELEMLRIDASQVTDAGIEHLAAYPKLRFLHLIDPQISGTALDTIAEMEQLESFYLDGAELPDDAWARLIEARPDLHIHVDQLHHHHDPQAADHSH